MGRTYFPGVDMDLFSKEDKKQIEKDIELDFNHALKGIRLLPTGSRRGVYLAYVYYFRLFRKIRRIPHDNLLHQRVRIPNSRKIGLMFNSLIRHELNVL
jgi:phytoene/squalene synthetase